MYALVLSVALSLALGAGATDAWPPDTKWIAQAEWVASEDGAAAGRFKLATLVETERSRVVTSDLVILGRVESLESYEPESLEGYPRRMKRVARTAITVEVEECLRGDCGGGHIVTSVLGGRVGDAVMVLPGARLPEIGEEYVLCLQHNPLEPGGFQGGYQNTRFHIEDGIVKRKGMPLDEFLGILRAHLAPRVPDELFKRADTVVVGAVTEQVFKYGIRVGLLGEPGCGNFAKLMVQQVLKGDLPVQEELRIELPPNVGPHQDAPDLPANQQVVVFLRRTPSGQWFPLGGSDSVVSVRQDGSVGGHKSLAELVAAAEGD